MIKAAGSLDFNFRRSAKLYGFSIDTNDDTPSKLLFTPSHEKSELGE